MRKRLIIGKRNLDIDFIQIFDNITYGKFFEKLYHIVWSGQEVPLLSRLFSQFFSKVFPQRIEKNILDAAMKKVTMTLLGGAQSFSHIKPVTCHIAGTFEAVLFYERLKHV